MYNISKQSGIEKKLKIVQELVFKIIVYVTKRAEFCNQQHSDNLI